MAYSSHIYKFTVEFSTIDNATGDMTTYDSAVLNVAIKKNFMSQSYPLYVLNLSLTEAERRNLVQNDFHISLRICRCAESDDDAQNDDESASSPITDKVVTDILLKPFDKLKTLPTVKAADDDGDESSDSADAQKLAYCLNCIPMEQLEINDSIINDCFSNANLNEIMLHELSSEYSGDIYFQESTNTTRYESLIIPPMSLIPALKYLQNNYMAYEENMNIFFEDSKLYVYDIHSDFSERAAGNRITIEVHADPYESNQTTYKDPMSDDDGNMMIRLDTNPIMMMNEDSYRNSTGGQMVFSSYDDNYNLVSRTYNTSDITGKTRYYWNADAGSAYEMAELSAIRKFTTITLRNMDPTYIEPDTEATITGSSIDDINGEYAAVAASLFYTTTDHKVFTNAICATFGKLNDE